MGQENIHHADSASRPDVQTVVAGVAVGVGAEVAGRGWGKGEGEV